MNWFYINLELIVFFFFSNIHFAHIFSLAIWTQDFETTIVYILICDDPTEKIKENFPNYIFITNKKSHMVLLSILIHIEY